jgi:hypothetical protein
MLFSSNKYLKKYFCFDLIYRSTNKNSLNLPSIKKCSFYVSNKNFFNLFCDLISIKTALSSCGARTKVPSKITSGFCTKTGSFFSSSLFLSKRSALFLMLLFSCDFKPFFINSQQSFFSISFKKGLSSFFPYTYYLSSLLFVDTAFNKKYSFFFSSRFCSGAVCLLSTFLPFFCDKKKANNFRVILCEVEQSGLAR